MTLSKLAQLAHASVSTVSKAFSGKGDISDATREHIFSVAREHGCFQQFYHMPYDRPVVAVVIPEAVSQTYLRYVETLRKELEKNEYTMLLSISNFDPQMLQELTRYYFEHGKVDGLILVGGSVSLPPDCRTVLICMGSNEDASIFPYVSSCDMHIDSTLAFDVNILKPYLEDILKKMPEDNEFIEGARRIIETIKDIEPVSREYLTEDSLYNEFI